MVTQFNKNIATRRNLEEEYVNNAYGGATAGLRITPIPTVLRKRRVSPDSAPQYANLLFDRSRTKPFPLKPLYHINFLSY